MLSGTGRRLCFDLETDGLLHQLTRIHILVIKDVDTKERWVFHRTPLEDNILDGIRMLNEAAMLIGHNIVGFDMKALWKVYGGAFDPTGIVRDTLVMVRMQFSDEKERDYRRWRRKELDGKLIGSHELRAWGQRLGFPKGDYSDVKAAELKALHPELSKQEINTLVWAEWNQEMEDYSVQDVEVTDRLWTKCESKPWPDFATKLEHEVHALMERVQENGFPLDLGAAEELETELRKTHEEKSRIAINHFGQWWVPDRWLKRDDKKCTSYVHPDTGNKEKNLPSFRPRSAFGEDNSREHWAEVRVPKRTTHYKPKEDENGAPIYRGDTEEGCPFCPVEIREFNPNSRPQIIDRLTKVYGWEPQEFTDEGNPKVSDEVLRDLAATVPICEELAEIFYYSKRLGQLVDGKNGLIGKAMERGDGKIHPRIVVGGAVTNRATHSNPNIAQVPRVVFLNLLQWKEPGVQVRHSRTGLEYGIPGVDADGNEIWDTNLTPLLGPDGKQIKGVPKLDVSGNFIIDENGLLKTKKTLMKGRVGDHGWDFRHLFYVPEGWTLMGADQKGIELRALAHYMSEFDNGEYIHIVVDQDPHDFNQRAMELESRDTAKTAIYACVPLDTEVLTRRGWKKHNELILGEDIMSYNAETGYKEWTPLLEVVHYDDAPLVHLHNEHNTFDVRCTPNHRWFVKRRTGKSHSRYFVDEVKTAEELTSECGIILNAPFSPEQDKIGKGTDWLLASPKYETPWTQRVLEMSQAEREAFLAGFLIADGYYTKWKDAGFWQFNQNIGELSEAAILASYLTSSNAININEYLNKNVRDPGNAREMVTARLRNKAHVTMQKISKTQIENAPVFCVRTKNQSFVMRQGSTITITGNTIYGAQDYKLGVTIDPNLAMRPAKAKALGAEMRRRLLTRIPALGQLVKAVQRMARKGFVTALDGRPLYVRAQHSALNTLLQGCGATISKLWCVYFEQFCEEDGLVHGWDGDFVILAWVHDELQIAVRDDPVVKDICLRNVLEAARSAGVSLNFRPPVDVDPKWGQRWSDTH